MKKILKSREELIWSDEQTGPFRQVVEQVAIKIEITNINKLIACKLLRLGTTANNFLDSTMETTGPFPQKNIQTRCFYLYAYRENIEESCDGFIADIASRKLEVLRYYANNSKPKSQYDCINEGLTC